MGSKFPESDENYEKLNAVIMRAITSSIEVRKVLLELKSKGMIKRSTVLNFLLGLEDLNDSINPPSHSDPFYKMEPTEPNDGENASENPNPKSRKRKETYQYGQNLTENERLFEAYCRENFDLKRWLKSARIRL